ncbi:MAG: hypothetical protein PVG65_05100, partial [Candidatus Thorarchaeota archaeon]
MKISNKIIWLRTLIALTVLLIYAYQPILCNAAEVWSDDFDDGNSDGWNISSGDFTCANGYLETTEVAAPSTGSLIYHESSIQHGTWSFDAYLLGNEWYLLIMVDDYEFHTRMLYVEVRNTRISIGRVSGIIVSWDSPKSMSGTWTHIDVTVDDDWTINVFVNNTHRINYDTLSLDTTDYLIFNPYTVGQAIDNIIVDDEIDYESLPFPTEYIPTTETT